MTMHILSRIRHGWSRRVDRGRPRWNRRGSEVLEMALVMPLLVYLIFGMVEFGYFFYLKHNLQAAAREGARTASTLNGTDGDGVAKASAFLTAANLTAGSFSISSTTSGDTVTVSVQATWGQIGILHLPLMDWSLPDSKVVKGVAVMRKEGA